MQAAIDAGRVGEEGPSRNRLQTAVLLDAIAEAGFDAAFGGARRDEERARAKERVFSFRDDRPVGPARPAPRGLEPVQRPRRAGEQRARLPLSNWTELDVWHYIAAEGLELPRSTSRTSARVFERDGMLLAESEWLEPDDDEEVFEDEGALPHGRRHDRDRRGADRGGRRWRT